MLVLKFIHLLLEVKILMIEGTKNLASFRALRGTILVALSGIFYGTLAYFGTMLIRENFSIPAMLFWRFLIAAVWMFLSSLSYRKNIFKNFMTPESFANHYLSR